MKHYSITEAVEFFQLCDSNNKQVHLIANPKSLAAEDETIQQQPDYLYWLPYAHDQADNQNVANYPAELAHYDQRRVAHDGKIFWTRAHALAYLKLAIIRDFIKSHDPGAKSIADELNVRRLLAQCQVGADNTHERPRSIVAVSEACFTKFNAEYENLPQKVNDAGTVAQLWDRKKGFLLYNVRRSFLKQYPEVSLLLIKLWEKGILPVAKSDIDQLLNVAPKNAAASLPDTEATLAILYAATDREFPQAWFDTVSKAFATNIRNISDQGTRPLGQCWQTVGICPISYSNLVPGTEFPVQVQKTGKFDLLEHDLPDTDDDSTIANLAYRGPLLTLLADCLPKKNPAQVSVQNTAHESECSTTVSVPYAPTTPLAAATPLAKKVAPQTPLAGVATPKATALTTPLRQAQMMNTPSPQARSAAHLHALLASPSGRSPAIESYARPVSLLAQLTTPAKTGDRDMTTSSSSSSAQSSPETDVAQAEKLLTHDADSSDSSGDSESSQSVIPATAQDDDDSDVEYTESASSTYESSAAPTPSKDSDTSTSASSSVSATPANAATPLPTFVTTRRAYAATPHPKLAQLAGNRGRFTTPQTVQKVKQDSPASPSVEETSPTDKGCLSQILRVGSVRHGDSKHSAIKFLFISPTIAKIFQQRLVTRYGLDPNDVTTESSVLYGEHLGDSDQTYQFAVVVNIAYANPSLFWIFLIETTEKPYLFPHFGAAHLQLLITENTSRGEKFSEYLAEYTHKMGSLATYILQSDIASTEYLTRAAQQAFPMVHTDLTLTEANAFNDILSRYSQSGSAQNDVRSQTAVNRMQKWFTTALQKTIGLSVENNQIKRDRLSAETQTTLQLPANLSLEDYVQNTEIHITPAMVQQDQATLQCVTWHGGERDSLTIWARHQQQGGHATVNPASRLDQLVAKQMHGIHFSDQLPSRDQFIGQWFIASSTVHRFFDSTNDLYFAPTATQQYVLASVSVKQHPSLYLEQSTEQKSFLPLVRSTSSTNLAGNPKVKLHDNYTLDTQTRYDALLKMIHAAGHKVLLVELEDTHENKGDWYSQICTIKAKYFAKALQERDHDLALVLIAAPIVDGDATLYNALRKEFLAISGGNLPKVIVANVSKNALYCVLSHYLQEHADADLAQEILFGMNKPHESDSDDDSSSDNSIKQRLKDSVMVAEVLSSPDYPFPFTLAANNPGSSPSSHALSLVDSTRLLVQHPAINDHYNNARHFQTVELTAREHIFSPLSTPQK